MDLDVAFELYLYLFQMIIAIINIDVKTFFWCDGGFKS